MASNRRTKKTLLPGFNDSDGSDYEGSSSERTIENMRHEIDVFRFYKGLLNENVLDLQSSQRVSSRKRCSKAVQTDPDASGIPPSWLALGQKYVDELYTGLANMINTLYHTPNGYRDVDYELSSKSLKYFTYADGYWQSKLLPQVKIPADAPMDKVHSEKFKIALHGLMEKATALKNVLPYVLEFTMEADPQAKEKGTKEAGPGPSGIKAAIMKVDKAVGPSGDHSLDDLLDTTSSLDISEMSDAESEMPTLKAKSLQNLAYRKPLANGKEAKEMVLSSKYGRKSLGPNQILSAAPKHKLTTAPARSEKMTVQIQSTTKRSFLHQNGDSQRVIKKGNNKNGIIIIEGKIASIQKTLPAAGKQNASNGLAGCSSSSNAVTNGRLKFQGEKIAAAGKENTSNGHAGCSGNSNAIRNSRLDLQGGKIGNGVCLSKEKRTANGDCLNREKRTNESGDTKAGKPQCMPNESKNFIKRNIMATKMLAHRAVTSKAVQEHK